MRLTMVLATFLLIGLVVSVAKARILVDQNCSPQTVAYLTKYVPTIAANLKPVFQNKFSYTKTYTGERTKNDEPVYAKQSYRMNLSRAEMQRIYEQLKNEHIQVECADPGAQRCDGIGAYAQGSGTFWDRTPRMVICDTTALAQSEPCNILGRFFHETAHLARIPYPSYHDQHNSVAFWRNRFKEDKIYQFGNAVEMMCKDGLKVK